MQSPFDDKKPLQNSQPVASSTSNQPVNKSDISASARDIFAANQSVNAPAPVTPVGSDQTYKPSGRSGPLAVPLLFGSAILIGVVFGWGYHFISQYFNLFIISEILLGALVGAAMKPAVMAGKCRNTKLAGLAGALAGLLTFGVYLASDAIGDREEFVQGYTEYIAKQTGRPPTQVRAKIESSLTPAKYFKVYMEDRAAFGATITSSSHGTKTGSFNIAGTWYWVMLGFEFLMIVGFGAGVASAVAGSRYHEEQDQWYKKQTLYTVQPQAVPTLLEMVQAGNWKNVREVALAAPVAQNQGGTSIYLYSVPTDPKGIVEIVASANNRVTKLFEDELNEEQLRLLRGTA